MKTLLLLIAMSRSGRWWLSAEPPLSSPDFFRLLRCQKCADTKARISWKTTNIATATIIPVVFRQTFK